MTVAVARNIVPAVRQRRTCRTWRTWRTWTVLYAVALCCATALWLSGCNIAGPILVVTQPEPTIPARFELEDRPTVVFVDDRKGILVPVALAENIAEYASEELMLNKVVTTTIRPRDAMALAQQHDRAHDLMAIGNIAKAVGADQIVYVQIQSFSEVSQDLLPKPNATAAVKVLDAVTQQRIFPPDDGHSPEYYILQTTMEDVDRELYQSEATRRKIREELAQQVGDDVAKLFYEHLAPNRLGERLNSR